MNKRNAHSNPADMPSERSFGLLFAAIFLALAIRWQILDKSIPALLALAGSLSLLIVSFAAPARLAPLNRAWFALGAAMAKVVNPVVMSVLFFVLITPFALVIKAMRRDALRLRLDRDCESYWIERTPPGPPADSLERQF